MRRATQRPASHRRHRRQPPARLLRVVRRCRRHHVRPARVPLRRAEQEPALQAAIHRMVFPVQSGQFQQSVRVTTTTDQHYPPLYRGPKLRIGRPRLIAYRTHVPHVNSVVSAKINARFITPARPLSLRVPPRSLRAQRGNLGGALQSLARLPRRCAPRNDRGQEVVIASPFPLSLRAALIVIASPFPLSLRAALIVILLSLRACSHCHCERSVAISLHSERP